MSLIAHYRLDGNADDALGQLNGVASGGVSWVDGKLGQGGEFNGVNGTIYLGTGADLFPLSSFSVSVWFKSFGTTPDTGTSPGILGLTYGIRLFVYPDLIQFGLDDGSTFTHLNSPASYDFYNDNLWHHVVISTTPTTMHLFIDGAEVASKAVDWKGTTRWPTNSLIIGKDNNNYPYHFTGLLDDVRIYDHALSKHEVKDLAKGLVFHLEATESGPKDKSLQGNTVVNNGASYVENVPVGKGGYAFTQDGQRIDTGSKFNFKKTDSFTVGFWINPEDHSSEATAAGGVIGKGHWYNNTWDVFMYSYNALCFECSGNATRNGYAQVVSPVLPLHQWSHFVVTYDAGSITGYLNGQVIGIATYSGTGDFNNTNNTLIGMRYGDVSRTLKGKLADVCIYTTALTADDIKELYQRRASLDAQGNFYASLFSEVQLSNRISQAGEVAFDGFSEIGITDGLVAYYPLTKDAKDYSGNGYDGVVNGAVPVGGGFSFDGSSSISADLALDKTAPQQWTVSALVWIDTRDTGGRQYLNNFNNGNILVYTPYSTHSLLYLNSGIHDSYIYGPTIPLQRWVHVVFRHDQTALDCTMFVENVQYGPSINYAATDVPAGLPATTVFGAGFIGKMKEIKIFNRALSPEEIAVEYKRTGPAKMTQYAGRTYIQGQFKEVIA